MLVSDLASVIKRRARYPSWQLFFILCGFVAGIFLASWGTFAFDPRVTLTSALVIFFVALIISRRDLRLLLLFFCAMSLGIARYQFTAPFESDNTTVLGQEVRIEGIIVNDPEPVDRNQNVVLDALTGNDEPINAKLLAHLPLYPVLEYGQRVSFRCKLETPVPINGFAYDRYLHVQGVSLVCFSHDEPYVIAQDQGNFFRSSVYRLRAAIELGLQRSLPEPTVGLAKGLLLGEKVLSDDLTIDFRRVGLSHILAASGYNVTAVLTLLFGGLIFFLRRQRAIFALLVGVVLYVLLAGAEAPVIRAGIMGATVLIARHAGRHSTPRNLLALTASVMLAFNPLLLRDDIGFQLSMLSTIGMTLWADRLSKRFAFIPETLGLREAWSASLAATAATLPLTIFQFGAISLVSPIANLLVLPFIPYAMALSACSAASALVLPMLAPFFGAPAWAIETLMLAITHVLAQLPFASIPL